MQKGLIAEFLGTFARIRRVWQCRAGRSISRARYRFCWRRTCIWTHCPNDGLCCGRYLRRAFQPGRFRRLAVAGKFPVGLVIPYIVVQVLGAIVAAGVLYVVASGKAGFELGGFAANGYGEHSPGGYSLLSALVIEVVLTSFFVFIILGSTSSRVPAGFAPIAIGLALTLIHLVSIPVTNTSVNPARSTGQALFVGGWALQQLWLFWVAPVVGGPVWTLTDEEAPK